MRVATNILHKAAPSCHAAAAGVGQHTMAPRAAAMSDELDERTLQRKEPGVLGMASAEEAHILEEYKSIVRSFVTLDQKMPKTHPISWKN